MKYALYTIVAIALIGCTPGYESKDSQYPTRPRELADCSIVQLTSVDGGRLTVVRCPNSTTTAQAPKHEPVITTEMDSITLNGIEYKRK